MGVWGGAWFSFRPQMQRSLRSRCAQETSAGLCHCAVGESAQGRGSDTASTAASASRCFLGDTDSFCQPRIHVRLVSQVRWGSCRQCHRPERHHSSSWNSRTSGTGCGLAWCQGTARKIQVAVTPHWTDFPAGYKGGTNTLALWNPGRPRSPED